jgi:hypothetical protein
MTIFNKEKVGAAAQVHRPLLRSERCDSKNCNAQAKTRAILKGDLQLLFCGHHTNEFKESLEAQGAILYRQPNIA